MLPAMLRLAAGLFGTLLLIGFAGCSASTATLHRERGYPVDAPKAAVLDVQVRRAGTGIVATNTSATSFGPCVLWINKSHRAALAGWKVGQTLTLDLENFRDEFGEPFRAGGFFSQEKPDAVVLAELEVEVQGASTPTLLGLVAVAERK